MKRVLVVLGLVPSIAQAEPRASINLNIGGEFMGNGRDSSAVTRLHGAVMLYHRAKGLALSLGATLGAGRLSLDDPRAIDGSLALSYLDYGPEVQLAMRAGEGFFCNRAFLSVAYLRTRVDERLRIEPIGDLGGTQGVRATIGVNWLVAQAEAIAAPKRIDTTDDGGVGKIVMFLLPQQVELGWIRSAGSNRVGITLSYGI